MKKASDEQQEQKPAVKEYSLSVGESPSAGIFRVVRGFYLKVVNGPLIEIKPGQQIELSKETYETLFPIGKIEPINIPEQFKVIKSFRTVIDGRYVDLCPGDIVEFDKPEGLSYWQKGFILPITEEV